MKKCCEFWTIKKFNYCPDCGNRLNIDAKTILEELNLEWTPRIAVDFDGCLCKSKYPDCGEPNLALIELMKDFKEFGCIIYLNTCRHDNALILALEWCKKYDLEFDFVNENDEKMVEIFGESRKLGCDLYIDDRCMKVVI